MKEKSAGKKTIRPMNPAVLILGFMCMVVIAAIGVCIRNVATGKELVRSAILICGMTLLLIRFGREIFVPCVKLCGDMVILRRFFYVSTSHRTVIRTDMIDLNRLKSYRYPNKNDSKYCEIKPYGRFGRYKPFEIVFVLEDGKCVPWNVKLYSKRKVRIVLECIDRRTGLNHSIIIY